MARAIHDLELHLIRLEGKLERMQIRTDLRTWLILFSIPVSAVLLLLVLTGMLRP
jgi:hypothetical protein